MCNGQCPQCTQEQKPLPTDGYTSRTFAVVTGVVLLCLALTAVAIFTSFAEWGEATDFLKYVFGLVVVPGFIKMGSDKREERLREVAQK